MERLKVFRSIEGAVLSDIEFIEDYVQLQLDTARITLGILPVVQIGDDRYLPDNERYRNLLISQIGKSISGVFAQGEQTTVIVFDDGSCLSISHENYDLDPTEMLVLEKDGEPIVVWD
jgi:hypothetical protein